MKTCSVVVTFESVDKILWCDHSNETSSAVLWHGVICFSICYKMKFEMFLKFSVFCTWSNRVKAVRDPYWSPSCFCFSSLFSVLFSASVSVFCSGLGPSSASSISS